jgi:hypothetical protein
LTWQLNFYIIYISEREQRSKSFRLREKIND